MMAPRMIGVVIAIVLVISIIAVVSVCCRCSGKSANRTRLMEEERNVITQASSSSSSSDGAADEKEEEEEEDEDEDEDEDEEEGKVQREEGKSRDFQIVVAHFNEDLSWLKPWKDDLLVFSKGSPTTGMIALDDPQRQIRTLPNLGREGHTYLTYIVENYNSLPKRVVFTQGQIDDHLISLAFQSVIESRDPCWAGHSHWVADYSFRLGEYCGVALADSGGHTFGTFWDEYMDGEARNPTLRVYWGAIFSVSRLRIRSRPLAFYQRLLETLSTSPNPEAGHFVERLWFHIFNANYCS